MNPPIRLRVVVLPQPDGPSRQKNSPGSMTIETSSRATASPYRFVAWRSSIAGTDSAQPTSHGPPDAAAGSHRSRDRSSRDRSAGIETHQAPSCATVCTMLASGLWPVNTAPRRWLARPADERLEPARADRRHRPWRNATDDELGARFQRALRAGPGAPADRAAGLPRPAVRPGPGRRRRAGSCSTGRSRSTWAAAGRRATSWSPTSATPGATTPAGGRPASRSGHVVPVGEPLARYTVVDAVGAGRRRASSAAGSRSTTGSSAGARRAFAAIPHLDNEVLDWRGPHPVQEPGRYAPTGQSGSPDDHARDVRHEPDRDVRLRAERHRRRPAVAPRDRAGSPEPSRSPCSLEPLTAAGRAAT